MSTPGLQGRKLVTHSGRDLAIAIGCAAVVLGLILWGIATMVGEQGKPSENQITGTIVAKHDSGEREQQITINRKGPAKGLKAQDGDLGLSLDVRVDPGGRIYEVPVTKPTYLSKKVGDRLTFIRPPSEQR